MGISDRDWYRDEMRRREASRRRMTSRENEKSAGNPMSGLHTPPMQSAWVWTVIVLAVMFALAMLVSDMKERGVPFTIQGLRWWLSLWWGPRAG